jgi:prophage antirepressor-like protein
LNTSILAPFQFEDQQVRAFLDEHGEPWFVAADVCACLGIGNSRDALSRLDEDEKGVGSTDTPGGPQVVATVNEPGLFNLVLSSRKPEARAFKRWITHEVLPSIRRTGSYTVPGTPRLTVQQQDTVGALLLVSAWLKEIPGVKPGILSAATLACIKTNTGLEMEELRKSLPSAEEPICSLNATQLGQRMSLSARATNQRLAAFGLQIRNSRDEWELTEDGQEWAEALPFNRSGHSGYQILWNPEVAEVLS